MPPNTDLEFYLEILDPRGHVRRFLLKESPVVIGRGQEAAVRLENDSVSRRHAEMTANDLGQWFIRDLKSRNGTFVNGRPVRPNEQQVAWQQLEPGDRIVVGDYIATLVIDSPAADWAMGHELTFANVPLNDAPSAGVAGLGEHARIQTEQLMTIGSFAVQLLQMESPAKRLEALCDLVLHPALHGLAAMGLRIDKADPARPQPLCQPRYSNRWPAGSAIHLSRGVLAQVARSGAPALATTSGGPQALEISIATAQDMALMACPLTRDRQAIDLLYVVVEPSCGSSDWLALLALAARQYEMAAYAWRAIRRAKPTG